MDRVACESAHERAALPAHRARGTWSSLRDSAAREIRYSGARMCARRGDQPGFERLRAVLGDERVVGHIALGAAARGAEGRLRRRICVRQVEHARGAEPLDRGATSIRDEPTWGASRSLVRAPRPRFPLALRCHLAGNPLVRGGRGAQRHLRRERSCQCARQRLEFSTLMRGLSAGERTARHAASIRSSSLTLERFLGRSGWLRPPAKAGQTAVKKGAERRKSWGRCVSRCRTCARLKT
jgi:hypothetical protein